METMIDCGASALELGFAFSDPIADGPTIQRAACATLASGFKVSDGFELVRQARALDSDIPIGLLVYYNMVLVRGTESFFREAAEAGADGVLIADLPPEAAEEITPAAAKFGIAPLFIVSPLTTSDRLDLILRSAGGFLYAVSRLGVTGVHEKYDAQLKDLLDRVHRQTDLPVLVGFGVSTPEQARHMIALGADGVITGSKIFDLVDAAPIEDRETSLRNYLRSMSGPASAVRS